MTALLRRDLPDGEASWSGDPPFNFVGGHNDTASVPFGEPSLWSTITKL